MSVCDEDASENLAAKSNGPQAAEAIRKANVSAKLGNK